MLGEAHDDLAVGALDPPRHRTNSRNDQRSFKQWSS